MPYQCGHSHSRRSPPTRRRLGICHKDNPSVGNKYVLQHILSDPPMFRKFAFIGPGGRIMWNVGHCYQYIKKISNVMMSIPIPIVLTYGASAQLTELLSHLLRNIPGGTIHNAFVLFKGKQVPIRPPIPPIRSQPMQFQCTLDLYHTGSNTCRVSLLYSQHSRLSAHALCRPPASMDLPWSTHIHFKPFQKIQLALMNRWSHHYTSLLLPHVVSSPSTRSYP